VVRGSGVYAERKAEQVAVIICEVLGIARPGIELSLSGLVTFRDGCSTYYTSGSQPFSSRDPIQKYDMVAQPHPLTATLKCSNNNRQDEKHILQGSLHLLYLHSYA